MSREAAAREDGSAKPSLEATSSQTSSSDTGLPVARTSDADIVPDTRGTGQPEPSAPGDSALLEAAAAAPKILKVAGAIVAPTTMLTALLFYFGQMYANGSFEYFGVNFTVLDLTVQDYLIRSADGLIIPLIVVAGATLLALWVHQLLLRALPARTHRVTLRVVMPCAAITGLVLVTLAIVDVISRDPVFPTHPETRGLNFSLGVLLLFYAARLLRRFIADKRPERVPRRPPVAVSVAEWGAVFILVSVGLFWAVGSYASLVGTGRAKQIEALLPSFPDVAAFSEKRLSLQAPGVREVICQEGTAYRFRYDGLKLVQQSGNQYLFLPGGWTHVNGSAILIPRSETLRLEFSPAGQVRDAFC